MTLRAFLAVSALAFAALAPAAAATAGSATCGSPPAGWKTSPPASTQVVNTVAVRGKATVPSARHLLPTWNGASVTPDQVREYVRVTTLMKPVPTLLLVVSPSADCGEVGRLRKMIDETLDCGKGQCVELGS